MEEISRERGIEAQLRATAQRAYRDQEDATDTKVAPKDYDLRQSKRVLELQNSDLWLRPPDLSWQLLILMTVREESFKNHRSRTDLGHGNNQRPGYPLLGDNATCCRLKGVLSWTEVAALHSGCNRL